ncbi:proline utilization protein PrnX [Xylariaceae sp. FL0016]|nr:proline utilization protein PrnX [Xylariaceae sp. FL0016]
MLILGEHDVKRVLTDLSVAECRRLLNSMSEALSDYSQGRGTAAPRIHQPQRHVFTTNSGNCSLFMPASNTATTGIKIVTLSGGGNAKGAINVFAPEGELLGLVNAEEVTAFRTALASMIAFTRSPLPKAHIVVFGAGKQAEWHIKLAVLLTAGAIQTVTVFSRKSSTLKDLDSRLTQLKEAHTSVAFHLVAKDESPDYEGDLRGALQASDAIMCCTPSTEPLFPASCLGIGSDSQPKRRFISLIGSYKPEMQEVDSATILSGSPIYVDVAEGCLQEAGELIKAGVKGSKLFEIGNLGADEALDTNGGNIIFKCVGMGIMDIVVAAELIKVAQAAGIGRTIGDF